MKSYFYDFLLLLAVVVNNVSSYESYDDFGNPMLILSDGEGRTSTRFVNNATSLPPLEKLLESEPFPSGTVPVPKAAVPQSKDLTSDLTSASKTSDKTIASKTLLGAYQSYSEYGGSVTYSGSSTAVVTSATQSGSSNALEWNYIYYKATCSGLLSGIYLIY